MLVLFETSAGYAIFRISDEKKLQNAEDVAAIFQNQEKSQKL
jgi:nucleolar protein 58